MALRVEGEGKISVRSDSEEEAKSERSLSCMKAGSSGSSYSAR